MIQTIIEFGLRKSILNHLLLLFIFILSVFAYLKIPKEIFPPSNMDAVIISGTYAGASSDILDKMAVEEIEDELLSVSSVDKITSVVKNGSFSITAELKEGEDSSLAVNDIKDIVTKVKTDLPSDMDEPTVKTLIQNFPLITVAVYSKTESSKEELLDIADEVKSKIQQLKDLENVTVLGKSDKELLISFDENKIEAFGLSNVQVVSVVQNLSSIFPVGIIKDKTRHYYLSTFNGEKDIQDIKNTKITVGDKTLYLSDIANIEYTFADVTDKSHFNAKPNVAISISKSEEGDSIELVKQIKEITKEFEKKYTNLEFDTYIDTSIWIKNRLNTVVSNILFGLMLLFIALLFFINVRIAIVIAIGIPTSFMIGLISSEALGYSLNMLSLLGALIALGMLVDEAIVVAENIYRHMEMGKEKFEAARDGAMEMYPAVLTATATTIFAFLPILLMSGETGKFMKILPIMISILLLSSLFEAFFFLPLHAKDILKVSREDRKSHKIWDFNKRLYRNILSFLLKGKYIALALLVGSILFSTVVLIKSSKFKFMPDFDSTQVYITGSVGVGKKIEQTEQKVFEIEKELLNTMDFKTEIQSISSVTGMKLDGRNQPQYEEFYFQIFINLYERAPQNVFDKYINPYLSPKYDDKNMLRDSSSQDIENQIKEKLSKFLNSKDFDELKVFVPKAGIVKNDIEIAVSGEHESVQNAVKTIKNALGKIEGVSNIADDSLLGNYELKFKVNPYGYDLGFTEEQVLSELRPLYFKGTYSKMFDDKGIIDIVFKSENKDVLSSLNTLEVTIPNSEKKVLLSNIVDFIKIPAYSQIFKENNKRITSVTASITNTTSNEVFQKLKSTLDSLKNSVTIDIKGEQKENEKVQSEMAQAAVMAIILIFIALVWMFDSIVKSIIIISTIPLSVLGVYFGHFIMGVNITMPSLIGMVGLAGVIVNDGIIMMDFIKKAKNLEELKDMALLRLRPILLTSLTTVLGLITLIFFPSGQALILQPMALALGFGILWATILNLYYVPMLYRIIYLRKVDK